MEDWTDYVHTGPGTLGGRYLRRFWQPVYRAQDLPPGRAVPIEIMSEGFTLYRGESGAPHLAAFRCAHRGTQLSVGWVVLQPPGQRERTYHPPFTHRESALRLNQGDRLAVRSMTATETDYGLRGGSEGRPPDLDTHFQMPNINQLRVRVRVPGYIDTVMWEDRLSWHVPVNDEATISFDVNLVADLTGDAADTFRQARRAAQEGDPAPWLQSAEAIMAGKMRVEDVDRDVSVYKLFSIEDYVTQVSIGRVPDRSGEHLGRGDLAVTLRRGLWQRELKALAEGRPLTQWTSPRLRADPALAGTSV